MFYLIIWCICFQYTKKLIKHIFNDNSHKNVYIYSNKGTVEIQQRIGTKNNCWHDFFNQHPSDLHCLGAHYPSISKRRVWIFVILETISLQSAPLRFHPYSTHQSSTITWKINGTQVFAGSLSLQVPSRYYLLTWIRCLYVPSNNLALQKGTNLIWGIFLGKEGDCFERILEGDRASTKFAINMLTKSRERENVVSLTFMVMLWPKEKYPWLRKRGREHLL